MASANVNMRDGVPKSMVNAVAAGIFAISEKLEKGTFINPEFKAGIRLSSITKLPDIGPPWVSTELKGALTFALPELI